MASTTQIAFKKRSCFKNAVASITTNLFIDLIAYTSKMGGQFTSTLAGNRTGCLIGGQRHSFTIFSTGNIIITNLFFLNELDAIYSFFVSLLVTLVKEEIAHINTEPGFSRKQVAPRELSITFLIENCQFSFQILPIIFKNKYFYEVNGVYCAQANHNSLANIKTYLYRFLRDKYIFKLADTKQNPIKDRVLRKTFPADLLTFTIIRQMCVDEFFEVKSKASRKRNKDDYKGQNISIHIFPNGKIIVTGMQTKEDLNPIFDTMQALVHYFL